MNDEFLRLVKDPQGLIDDLNDPARRIAQTTVGYARISTIRLPKIDAVALDYAELYEVAVDAGQGWIPAGRCVTREMAVKGHMFAFERVVFELAQRQLPRGTE